jgi:hypothetical protein
MVPVVIAAAAWTVTTGGAHAQTESTAVVDIARAVELERQAEIANGNRRTWSDAASLFLEASHLRPENDPIALGNIRMVGAIYGETGQLHRAKRTMLDLADGANAFGEVATAAHALMDAAHLSVELNDASGARSAYERAHRLAMSSHLTGEQRREIASRLAKSPGVFASARR